MAARGGVGDEVLDDARMLGMQAGDVVVDGVERDTRPAAAVGHFQIGVGYAPLPPAAA